jgi:predicted pyridoxine 5'-phosphate oxidase superfamily flavin-nucleotide-binding protein
MPYGFLDLMATPSVKSAQAQNGVAALWEGLQVDRGFDRFTENEAAFISARDSFYMATVSESGWPYVQHRGGPAGFLKVLDETTLGFADFRGNRQYLSLGNLAADDRAALILVDYPNQARLKILAHAETLALDADPDLAARLVPSGYKARPERLFRLRLETFDWNCAQHIQPRFTPDEIETAIAPLRARLGALEAELRRLRGEELGRVSP